MTVAVYGIAYMPVGHEMDEDWLQSSRDTEIDEDILDIFRDYLSNIILKKDIKKVGVGHFDEDENSGIQDWLDEIREFDLSLNEDMPDYDRFEALTRSLATRLVREMDDRSSDGVLFTIQGDKDGESFVGILKLDLDDEHRSVLEENTNRLRYEELNRALPETESLQKGCTYPVFQSERFDLTGDVKFLQEDSPSDYFEEFLGCLTSSASLEQMRNILEGIGEIKEERVGRGLSLDDIHNFEDAITDGENQIATNEQVHTGAQQILGQDYSETAIEDMLREKGEAKVRIDPDYAPRSAVLTLDRDIKITGPIDAFSDDRIDVQEPETEQDEWIVTIRASSLDKSIRK